ncbi:MAG: hypothetical protein JWM58_102 [Rhizobium sp.]|nr:hypothetical protein [Rhizobium sp.]
MNKHPWLAPSNGAVQALGGLEKLRHNYLPADYLRDAARHNVVATVHIEALWDASEPVGETKWLESLDKSGGVAMRYIAAAPLGTPQAAAVIAEQASFERVAGIRGILSYHPTESGKSFVARPDIAADPDWRRDVGLLADAGLHLELMAYPYQAQAVAELAAVFPKLQIIVNHCASPVDRDGAGMQRWRDGLAVMAARPNVALKISNPGAYDPDWTEASIEAVVMNCIDAFSPDRCMFGTDYPVAKLQMNFDQIFSNFKRITADFPIADQRALFHDNALRFYRL